MFRAVSIICILILHLSPPSTPNYIYLSIQFVHFINHRHIVVVVVIDMQIRMWIETNNKNCPFSLCSYSGAKRKHIMVSRMDDIGSSSTGLTQEIYIMDMGSSTPKRKKSKSPLKGVLKMRYVRRLGFSIAFSIHESLAFLAENFQTMKPLPLSIWITRMWCFPRRCHHWRRPGMQFTNWRIPASIWKCRKEQMNRHNVMCR